MFRDSRATTTATGCGTLSVTSPGGGGGVEPPWEIMPPTTTASEPLPARTTVPFSVEARNNDDTSETVVIDGEPRTGGRYTATVKLNGTDVGTVEFVAAVNTSTVETIDVTVPDTTSMELSVAGSTSTFSVSNQSSGDLQILSSTMSQSQATVGETVGVTAEVGCMGGPNNSPCDDETFKVTVDGRTVEEKTLGGWAIAQVQDVSASFTPTSAGTKTVTVSLGGQTKTHTLDVSPGSGCPTEGCPDGEHCVDGACVPESDLPDSPIGVKHALAGAVVLGGGYYAYKEGML